MFKDDDTVNNIEPDEVEPTRPPDDTVNNIEPDEVEPTRPPEIDTGVNVEAGPGSPALPMDINFPVPLPKGDYIISCHYSQWVV